MMQKKTSQKADQDKQEAEIQKEKQICDLELLITEKEEKLLRALADLQNVRRRSEEDRVRLPQIGAEKIILAVLPTLDHLELALQKKPEQENEWIKGVESIFSTLFSALVAEGLEKIDASGVPVDPEKHHVLAIDEKAKAGEVGEICQSGYIFRGKIIRAAKVKAGIKN